MLMGGIPHMELLGPSGGGEPSQPREHNDILHYKIRQAGCTQDGWFDQLGYDQLANTWFVSKLVLAEPVKIQTVYGRLFI